MNVSISILTLILAQFSFLRLSNADEVKILNRVTIIPSAIWMRNLSQEIKQLCSTASEDCSQESYAIDPFQNEISASDSFKEAFVKNSISKAKIVNIPLDQITNELKKVVKEAKPYARTNAKIYLAQTLQQIHQLEKEYQLTAFQAVSYSPADYHLHFILVLRHEKFDLGEAIVLSTGPKVYFGGIGLPAGAAPPPQFTSY